MLKHHYVLVVFVMTFVCFSCTKEVPAELNVTTAELTFTKDGGSQSISFSTNKDWTASSPVSWAKVTSSGSSSATSINVTVEANTDYFDRTATITIKAENLTKTVNIYQGQTNDLFLTKSDYAVSYSEHDITVEVKANVEFVVSSEADWITYVETKGLKTSNLSLNIAKNETYDKRVGVVKVKQTNGSLESTITINQEGKPINIPDANFKAYCVANFDTNGDGEISIGEVKSIEIVDCENLEISSLVGIEYFTSLDSLDCSENQLTSLDVSKNTALTYLNCYTNQLTSLDVSNNTALTSLGCGDNPIVNLDVSKNTALTSLGCVQNQLTSLDVSNNTALFVLLCNDNQLTCLDLGKNTTLSSLFCNNNQLTSLDVSKNTALTFINCNSNQLTNLDVSNNAAMTYLSCTSNPYLTELWLKRVRLFNFLLKTPKQLSNTNNKKGLRNQSERSTPWQSVMWI